LKALGVISEPEQVQTPKKVVNIGHLITTGRDLPAVAWRNDDGTYEGAQLLGATEDAVVVTRTRAESTD
jgi:hypothetical protein